MLRMKIRAFRLVLIAMFAIFAVAMLAPRSYANPWVSTYDIYDNPTDVFEPGDIVRIKAYSNFVPYDIIVKDPNGVTIWNDTSSNKAYSKDVPGITTTLGWWSVQAGTAETHFAIAWYHVIPEIPLGVLAVLGTCFAGLAFHKIRITKTEK